MRVSLPVIGSSIAMQMQFTKMAASTVRLNHLGTACAQALLTTDTREIRRVRHTGLRPVATGAHPTPPGQVGVPRIRNVLEEMPAPLSRGVSSHLLCSHRALQVRRTAEGARSTSISAHPVRQPTALQGLQHPPLRVSQQAPPTVDRPGPCPRGGGGCPSAVCWLGLV